MPTQWVEVTEAVLGHAPSPYLRRLRLPNLGTLRPHDNDDLSPEEEYNKLDLIRARMVREVALHTSKYCFAGGEKQGATRDERKEDGAEENRSARD